MPRDLGEKYSCSKNNILPCVTCRKGIVSEDRVLRLFGAFSVAGAGGSLLVCAKRKFKFPSGQ